MKNNPWGLPDGTKLLSKYGMEFQYCQYNGEWMLYNPWNNSYYGLDWKFQTERDMFDIVSEWPRWDHI